MYDITLIGGGIMSATLGKLLKELNPEFKILILESMPQTGLESSGSWNNAGTGHSALCELNYTPEVNGKIDIQKALHITESFEISRQFWSYFVKKEGIDPTKFIHSIPHMSYVGEDDIAFLKKRYEKMKTHHFYEKMQYSENLSFLIDWIPLVMKSRKYMGAATYMESGTDVDFGALTKLLIDSLVRDGVEIMYNQKVTDIKYSHDEWVGDAWQIKHNDEWVESNFVFIGAGGASLLLLEKTGIPESKVYGGFPISGQWLICKNKEVIEQHHAKVYGKASVGAPPMSVPHLDTRIINGEKQLLFGPYAGFSTKFLKNGSYLDLFKSIKISNLWAMIKAGWNNIPLTKYLIKEVTASFEDKFNELLKYYPNAKKEDWEIKKAGQRVQVIKKDKKKGGILEFGTEVVASKDGTMSALLGASPGASTSVHIMLELINKCFPYHMDIWEDKLSEMIPSYGKSLIDDKELYEKVHEETTKILKLNV